MPVFPGDELVRSRLCAAMPFAILRRAPTQRTLHKEAMLSRGSENLVIRRPGQELAAAVLLGLLVCGRALPAAEQTAQAVRAATPPTIDGTIHPEEWQGATRLERFLQLEPRRGQPATEPTVAYLLFDDHYVYVGVYSYDSEPEKITARLTRRDGDLSWDDSVTVFLDTFHDRRTCYFFSTNPLSTLTDGRVKDDGRVGDTTWDAEWQAAARIVSDGWTAEFAIPLRVIQFRAGEDRTWGFNIGRTRRANLETSFWAGPLEAAHRVSQYGELRGLRLPRGGAKPWSLIPYVLGRTAQGGNTTGSAGFDLRYAFRPETTANLTVNPDFAIIEADEEFVNLTRFEVRLEEKRPFFLESNDRFRQRIQTFYSRRIEDIDVGGKLLSRNGPWDLAFLAARSPHVALDPLAGETPVFDYAHYAIARVERQFLKSSTLGIMLADRHLGGEHRGSSGLDTTMHLTRRMNFTGQLARAHGPFRTGRWAYFLRPAWDTSTFHYHFRYTHLGDHFGDNANALGFIPDDDRREMDSDLTKTLWFEKGVLQRVELTSGNNIYWSQQNVLRSYHNFLGMALEFRDRWVAGGGYNNDFKRFEKGFHNDFAHVWFGYNTREFNSFDVAYQKGRSFDSDFTFANFRISRKLTRDLAVEYRLRRVWLTPDPERKAALISVLRVQHNFTRDLFLRVFFQTNSAIDRKNLEAVFVWRHKPPFGSIQFAFQRGRAAFGQPSEQGNTFFVKISHVL